MRDWSKVKVFFLLILLIGTVLHLLVNLLYFSLHQKQVIGDYSSVLFLISLLFIVFATVVFCKKNSGFLKRASVAVVISLLQIFLFILTFAPFAFLDGMSEFLAPELIQGDQKFGQTVEARFSDKYGIDIGDTKVISHSSYWRIGEEFGYDLIISIKGDVSSAYAPKGSDFSPLQKSTDNTPFRFSNLQFICKNTMGSDLKISDDRISDLLCSEKGYPDDTLIAEKRVREDWTVTSVFFPSQGILWITETEW
jgi:hypothetical protein